MIATEKPDCIWVDFENIMSKSTPRILPKNGITAKMISEKYNVSVSTARRIMTDAEENGAEFGYFIQNGSITRYIIPIQKES